MAMVTGRGMHGLFGTGRSRGRPWVAIVMIGAGIAAVAVPAVAGFSVLGLVAVLFLLNGAIQIGGSLSAQRLRSFAWHALVGLVYLAAGGWLLLQPQVGLASLALLMAVVFMMEGGILIGGFWATRRVGGSVWMLINGALAAALGAVVLMGWPEASGEMIGVLLGANLILAGVTRLAARPEFGTPPPA